MVWFCQLSLSFFSYRLDPPSQSIISVGQELFNLTEEYVEHEVPILHPIKDLGFNDIDFVDKYKRLKNIEEKLSSYKCLDCPSFDEHVSLIDHILVPFSARITWKCECSPLWRAVKYLDLKFQKISERGLWNLPIILRDVKKFWTNIFVFVDWLKYWVRRIYENSY